MEKRPDHIVITVDDSDDVQFNLEMGDECCFNWEQELIKEAETLGVVSERRSTFCKIPLAARLGRGNVEPKSESE